MSEINFDIKAWSAWAPGVVSRDDWLEWVRHGEQQPVSESNSDLPDVSFIPAMQRRRLSRLSKMSLWTLYQCVQDHNYRCVFASPHGEIHRTENLLNTLAEHEPLSPMGFSLSVHNTTAGVYSIVAQNTAPSNSVAAGKDTLEQAMLEAVAQSRFYGEVVVLSYADEPLPEIYRSDFAVSTPFSITLLVDADCENSGGYSLSAVKSLQQDVGQYYSRLNLVAMLLGESAQCLCPGEHHYWCWRRE